MAFFYNTRVSQMFYEILLVCASLHHVIEAVQTVKYTRFLVSW